MQLTQSSKTNSNSQLINKWLNQRQTLIVALSNLCHLRPFSKVEPMLLNETLQEFCILLVDYISLGHFEVYEHISDAIARNYAQAGISQRILQNLMDTTVHALDFNDHYMNKTELNGLDKDLSKLALIFAQRLEWEDRLIATYQLAKTGQQQLAKTA